MSYQETKVDGNKLIEYVVSKKYSLLEQIFKTISWKASPSIKEKRQATK